MSALLAKYLEILFQYFTENAALHYTYMAITIGG